MDAGGQRRADAHRGQPLGQLDLDGRPIGVAQPQKTARPEGHRVLTADDDHVGLVDVHVLVARGNEPGGDHLFAGRRLVLEVATVLDRARVAGGVGAEHDDLLGLAAVDGDQLRLDGQRLAGQPEHEARRLPRRQPEGLAAGQLDAASARRPQELRPRVLQATDRHPEPRLPRELGDEGQVHVRSHAIDRSVHGRPDRGERRREEHRVLEGHARARLLDDPRRRQRVERRRVRRRARLEGHVRPDQPAAEVEQRLEPRAEDASVAAHRIERQGGAQLGRVERLAAGVAVAGMLEDGPIARGEVRQVHQLARGQELALAGAAHRERQHRPSRSRIGTLAVRAAERPFPLLRRDGRGGDLHRLHFLPLGGPGVERQIEGLLGRQEAPRPASLIGGILGQGARSHRGPERGAVGQIEREQGHVDAGAEGLHVPAALAGEGAAPVEGVELDCDRLAVAAVLASVVAHGGADHELAIAASARAARRNVRRERRSDHVAIVAGDGVLERPPAHHLAQGRHVERLHPARFRLWGHAGKLSYRKCARETKDTAVRHRECSLAAVTLGLSHDGSAACARGLQHHPHQAPPLPVVRLVDQLPGRISLPSARCVERRRPDRGRGGPGGRGCGRTHPRPHRAALGGRVAPRPRRFAAFRRPAGAGIARPAPHRAGASAARRPPRGPRG